jgi:hypothetical protein
LSFDGVGAQVEVEWHTINNAPLGDEQLEFGRDIVAKNEERRLAAMNEYRERKASPT